MAYLFLAANPYPGFYLGSNPKGYPVDVTIDPPERQNRWVTGFRLVLVIPAALMAAALSGGGSAVNSRGGSSGGVSSVAAVLTWFSALVRGRSPRGLRDFIAWSIGPSDAGGMAELKSGGVIFAVTSAGVPVYFEMTRRARSGCLIATAAAFFHAVTNVLSIAALLSIVEFDA